MEFVKPDWLEQMEGILETLNEGVLISDECDHVLFVNSSFEEMTGVSRADIVGRDPGKLYYSPEEFAVLQELRRKTRDLGRGRHKFHLPTKSGERLPVVVSARVIEDPDGRSFSIVTFTDISEQKTAEHGLRQANAQLEERQREMEDDLSLAERVQQSLAPKSVVWGDLRVEAFYRPVRSIGGDFGLVRPLDEEHLNVVVCDVSGHGISSALIANRIYSETITHLNNSAPLGDILRKLNGLMIENIGNSLFYFTLSAARISRDGRHMAFAGAGHPPAMIVQPGAIPRLLESRSSVLGTLPEAVDADPTLAVDLRAGDRVVLYTDGLTDAFDSRGQMLGVTGVRKIVEETALLPLCEMQAAILERVAAWRQGPPSDDISLVLVEV
jgi:sigma-B regulation protein RsbU (phosphoserine phosphatase)